MYDLVKLETLVEDSELKYKLGYAVDIPVGIDLQSFGGYKQTDRFNNKVFEINSK